MNQHTVPRFLLNNFTTGKKRHIWVYDKHKGTAFRTNVKNVTAERGFYDLSLPDGSVSLEPHLARLEERSAPLIKELLRQNTLSLWDTPSRQDMATFFAALFVRTKEYRLRFDHLTAGIKDHFSNDRMSDELRDALLTSPDHSKEMALHSLVSHVPDLAQHFLNKTWVLFRSTAQHPLYISDHPLTLHNELDHSPYGNIGFAVRGIELYCPIASTTTLGFWDEAVVEPFRQASRNIQSLDRLSPQLVDRILENPSALRASCRGLETGSPIPLRPETVMMLNSLQVMYSSRFVYCENEDFSLVDRMLRDNPRFKEGLKPKLG